MAQSRVEVLLTGGGTAGHVYPALALARALVERGYDKDAVLFVGARHGLERELVPPTGYPYRLLPGRGITRRASPRNVVAIGGLAWAGVLAVGIVMRRRPKVVVAVGGYGGVACSLAAWLFRVPVVTVNVDAVIGAANRLIGRFAVASTVGYDDIEIAHAVRTGVPIREEMLTVERSPLGRRSARQALGVPDDVHLVAVVGGSLGSKRLNDAAVGLRSLLAHRGDIVLHHVSGARDYDALVESNEPVVGGLEYRLVRFEERMPDLLAAADIVIARAGAITVAELRCLGTPSVLVPLPGAPSDHQTKNARALESLGAAVVVADAVADAEHLAAIVVELLADPVRLEAMATAARSDANRDAAAAIATLVDNVATGRWRAR